MDRADRIRHELLVPRALGDRVEALARVAGASASKIVESLALFVRCMSMVNPPLAQRGRAPRLDRLPGDGE